MLETAPSLVILTMSKIDGVVSGIQKDSAFSMYHACQYARCNHRFDIWRVNGECFELPIMSLSVLVKPKD